MAKDIELHRLHAASPKSPRQRAQFQYVQRLRNLYARRRYCEVISCAMGFLGILLMLAQNEMLMNTSTMATGHASTKRDTGLVVLKSLTSFSTAILVVLILVQYGTRTEIAKMQNAIPETTNFFLAQLPMILLELLLCSFHIPPGVRFAIPIRQFHSSLQQQQQLNATATTATEMAGCPIRADYDLVQQGHDCYLVYRYPVEALGVFMVVRLYLLARYLRSSSGLYSQWVAFIGSLNDINAMKPFFHFKAIFKIRPMHLLVPLTLLNTFLTAAIIRILEHPVQASFANYWKSVWLTAVTMTATGFGDYFPVTFLGRMFTIVSAMFGGVLLLALVQSLFFGVLELSPRELKVKYLIDLDTWEVATHGNAATLIQRAWKFHRNQDNVGRPLHQQKLYTVMRQARALRASKPEMSLSLEEQIAEMEHVVLVRMRAMEDEEARILDRIQAKTRQVGLLKTVLQKNQQNQQH